MPFLTSATDSYGFWIAKSDGNEARNFLNVKLPKELPDMQGSKIVNTYQMDEGLNHPGYRVYDTRKVDISQFDFDISIGAILPVDLAWLEGIFQTEKQILISWKTGFNVYALFQEKGFQPSQYPLNLRELCRCKLLFHLVGQTSTTFSMDLS